MKDFSQGDLVKISGFKNLFLIVSKNAFIKSTGMFHVCPAVTGIKQGPLHIEAESLVDKKAVTILCEQIKLIDPKERRVSTSDRISYSDKMEISDALQGIFEYD